MVCSVTHRGGSARRMATTRDGKEEQSKAVG